MRRFLTRSALSLLVLAVPALAGAQEAPAVGDYAPDFSAAWADASGPRQSPITLSENRGRVVVLAFYPKDRSSGCTAQLTKYRDEFDTLFGSDVLLLPVSVDDVNTHAAWAKEMNFPFALVADPNLEVAALYGSKMDGRPMAARTIFVIGKDGRIAWRDMRVNALSEQSYTALAEAVKAAREAK